jgi:ABC-type molybdate transport system substrate-binding protein
VALKKLWIVWMLGIFLAGCGAGGQAGLNEADAETNDKGSGVVAGEMAPSLTEKSKLEYQYEVKNQTEKEVTLEFTSSQRFDYSVETAEGEEVFLFSSVASFLQVLGEETVKQGAALTYDIDLRDLNLKTGNYLLTAWMTPKEGPAFKVTKEITVE